MHIRAYETSIRYLRLQRCRKIILLATKNRPRSKLFLYCEKYILKISKYFIALMQNRRSHSVSAKAIILKTFCPTYKSSLLNIWWTWWHLKKMINVINEIDKKYCFKMQSRDIFLHIFFWISQMNLKYMKMDRDWIGWISLFFHYKIYEETDGTKEDIRGWHPRIRNNSHAWQRSVKKSLRIAILCINFQSYTTYVAGRNCFRWHIAWPTLSELVPPCNSSHTGTLDRTSFSWTWSFVLGETENDMTCQVSRNIGISFSRAFYSGCVPINISSRSRLRRKKEPILNLGIDLSSFK